MPNNQSSPTPSSRPVAGSRTRVLTSDDLRQLVHVVPGWGTNSPGGLKARNLADALDVAKAARSGCGKPFWADVDCGAYAVNDPEPLLCYDCKALMWSAISALLGGDDA